MANITRNTKFSEIKVGDVLLNGKVIDNVSVTASGRYKISPLFNGALKDATLGVQFPYYGLTEAQVQERMNKIKI